MSEFIPMKLPPFFECCFSSSLNLKILLVYAGHSRCKSLSVCVEHRETDASKQKFEFVCIGEKWMHPNRILNLFVLERNGCIQTEILICLYWGKMDASKQKFEFVCIGEKWMHPNRNFNLFVLERNGCIQTEI